MAGIKIKDVGLVENIGNNMKIPVGIPETNLPGALSVEQLKSHILKEINPRVEGIIIRLCGIGTLDNSNVTDVNDIYFNTSDNTLRKCTIWRGTANSSAYETIDFYPGALYTMGMDLYSWNGTHLIKITENIVINDTGEIPNGDRVDMYIDLSGGDGKFEGAIIPEAPKNGKSYIRQDGAWHEYLDKNVILNKVDKISGKQLSSNDFTNEYKTKLDNIPNEGGPVFIPKVDQNGILSWTNNASLDNPVATVIRGPKGDSGATLPGQVTLTQDFGIEEGSEDKVISRKAISQKLNDLDSKIGILNSDLTKILEG